MRAGFAVVSGVSFSSEVGVKRGVPLEKILGVYLRYCAFPVLILACTRRS